jgi:hypothetical protein
MFSGLNFCSLCRLDLFFFPNIWFLPWSSFVHFCLFIVVVICSTYLNFLPHVCSCDLFHGLFCVLHISSHDLFHILIFCSPYSFNLLHNLFFPLYSWFVSWTLIFFYVFLHKNIRGKSLLCQFFDFIYGGIFTMGLITRRSSQSV